MIIELFFEFDDNDMPILNSYEVEINENSSIEELFDKLHIITEIPKFRELKWNGEIIKVSCSYAFLSESNSMSYASIDNLDKPIKDFPKNGKDGKLSLFIEKNVGLVN